jgi:hypothetical protein
LLKISTIVKYENDVTDKASQLMQETVSTIGSLSAKG